jgi:two-component sensor histidine kinase
MMILYDKLYRSDKFIFLSIKEYLTSLIVEIIKQFNNPLLKIKADIAEIDIDTRYLIYIGIILNELITNSMKHAFGKNKSGLIDINIYCRDYRLFMKIEDNGIGIGSIEKSKEGFGFQMIKFFLEQLKGSMDIKIDHGTIINIDFPIDNIF